MMHVDHNCQANSGRVLAFRDLTTEIVTEMDDEQRDDLGAALHAGFLEGGDPRCWIGYPEISDDAKLIMEIQYTDWSERHSPDIGFGEHAPIH